MKHAQLKLSRYVNVIVPLVTTFLSQIYCPTFPPRKRDCSERGEYIFAWCYIADAFCQILVNLFVTVFCSLYVCSCTDTMETSSNKKRNYDNQDTEPECRQKRNFPPSYGSKRAMLSVLKLIFCHAMMMLFHKT